MSEEQTPFQHAKPTPGPYTMNAEGTGFYARKDEPYILMAPLSRSDEERRANAALAFQAFNVRHETGLTPRELSEQRAELLEALKIARGVVGSVNRGRAHRANNKHGGEGHLQTQEWCDWALDEVLPKIDAAIAKARGGAA